MAITADLADTPVNQSTMDDPEKLGTLTNAIPLGPPSRRPANVESLRAAFPQGSAANVLTL